MAPRLAVGSWQLGKTNLHVPFESPIIYVRVNYAYNIHMDEGQLLNLAKALQDVLEPHLKCSKESRRAARMLGQWLLDCSCELEGDHEEEAASPELPTTASVLPEEPATIDRAVGNGSQSSGENGDMNDSVVLRPMTTGRAIVPLKIGDAYVCVPIEGTTEEIGRARQSNPTAWEEEPEDNLEQTLAADIDLLVIQQRCRIKSESCLLFIERRAVAYEWTHEPIIVDRLQEMIGEAKALPNCFLWVFWRERTQPDDETLRVIARCYEALGETASLVHGHLEAGAEVTDPEFYEALQLLTEANSGLWVVLERSWLTVPDTDQDEVHAWLRYHTSKWGIYIRHFMKISDRADPESATRIITEVKNLRQRQHAQTERQKRIQLGFGRIRYHAGLLRRNGDRQDGHDYRKIEDSIQELCEMGVNASDTRFEEALGSDVALMLPHVAKGKAGEVVANVIHREETRREATIEILVDESPRWSDRVARVREMLRGRQVVIIGGEARTEASERIKEAFDLSSVDWVRLTEHGSGQSMRAPIERPETALVLVLIKLVGHHHAEEACAYAHASEKPFVYVPAGYHPEQIARAVMDQASGQLTADQICK